MCLAKNKFHGDTLRSSGIANPFTRSQLFGGVSFLQ